LLESKKKLAEKERENIQNELKALQAQINPHFLFNSLNTIYSLALKKAPTTPEVILKLSDVLRYMIYESNEKYVNLEKEIKFIRNYIELQKLRTHVSEVVSFEVTGKLHDQKIAPLILIVLIENAFKHGLKGDIQDQFIRIRIDIRPDEIDFFSENNMGKSTEIKDEIHGGLGLENIKRRLDIMYPNQHELTFDSGEGIFSVRLKIRL
jgi:LytS/YehU family sensor histidine kinase